MPYVMVPVPEEHEAELLEEIMRLSLASYMKKWDIDQVRSVMAVLSPQERSFVVAVARYSSIGEPGEMSAIADELGTQGEDLIALREQLNGVCRENSFPELMLFDPTVESLPDGSRKARNVFAIARPVARMVLVVAEESASAPE